ncbi:MAG: aa3-type cytochrome c oxidase subunit IV [Proteobacteria bacterium]|nr:aa3-type cytochrome c oxidase subunit IV [Pseudomonadota bacterium]MDA1057525.1 aa3-type cytochrome c oxidase subunit IV [Pseudomonadota bacterium]
MAENEQIDLPQKQQMWAGFTRLVQWVGGLTILILVLMAIFLL